MDKIGVGILQDAKSAAARTVPGTSRNKEEREKKKKVGRQKSIASVLTSSHSVATWAILECVWPQDSSDGGTAQRHSLCEYDDLFFFTIKISLTPLIESLCALPKSCTHLDQTSTFQH